MNYTYDDLTFFFYGTVVLILSLATVHIFLVVFVKKQNV